MALTYTLAGAQTQLDALETAVIARSWSDAYDAVARYRLIRAGIPTSGGHDGSTVNLPDPDQLTKAVNEARRQADRTADQGRRLGRARVRHG